LPCSRRSNLPGTECYERKTELKGWMMGIIKRFTLRTLTCSLVFCLFAGAALGADFSKDDLKRMSTFLSNFTELSMHTFDAATVTRDELITFGILHNDVNNNQNRIASCTVKDCPYGSQTIDAAYVTESIKKYFDVDFKDHASVKPNFKYFAEYLYYFDGKRYHFSGADGDMPYYARVEQADKNDEGQVIMKGILYNADDESDIYGTFEAAAKPHKFGGKNTWAIVSMKTEKRQ
jgi:hypothetical protein